MKLDIVTPEKTIFQGDITSLMVPTTSGEITVLPHHINLLTELIPGEVVIKDDRKTHYLGVTGGFLEITNNTATILADYAVASDEIAAEKAVEAQEKAEELKKRIKENISEQDLAIASGELRRSLMELHVSTRRRRRQI